MKSVVLGCLLLLFSSSAYGQPPTRGSEAAARAIGDIMNADGHRALPATRQRKPLPTTRKESEARKRLTYLTNQLRKVQKDFAGTTASDDAAKMLATIKP